MGALRPTRVIGVVGFQADAVREALDGYDCRFVLQRQQRGTGHAVLQAAREIGPRSTLLVVNGDLPMIQAATLRRLVTRHRNSGGALTILTTTVDDPGAYGRIVRDAKGELTRIVEHRDAGPAERKIREINCGIYCAKASALLPALKRTRPNNAAGEYYITDAVELLIREKARVLALCHDNAREVLGVNTRAELAQATAEVYGRKAAALQ